MGCVTCSLAQERSVSQMTHSTINAMLEPNTLVGEPVFIEPEPFINFVYENLLRNSDKPFLTDAADGRRYTFGDLLQRSSAWAEWLKERGLGKGNIVAISSENDMDGFSVLVGTWLSGAAANPFNFNFTASDIKIMFECTEPDIIYCNKNLELIEDAVELVDKKPPIVTPGGENPKFDSEAILSNFVSNFEPYFVEDSKEHVLSIMFTSGTTGNPKGIQMLDNNLKIFSKSEMVNQTPSMITSPMFWVSNLIMFSNSMYNCTEIILPKKGWTPIELLQTIQKYKPKSWFTGHSLLLDMAQKDYINDYDLTSLRYVVTGGNLQLAKQRREINEKVFKNHTFIRHLYGSTEVGMLSGWVNDINLDNDEYNSVGTVGKGALIKVMDSSGRQLGPMKEGEIWAKTHSMTNGYMTAKRKIVSPLDENGWYHMGDLGYYDEKKLIYIVGRLKDVLKFRGVQIAPVEIENVLNEHPDVFESCVVGKFDPANGDIPVAFVVLRESATVTVDELHDFLKGILAEVKRPHEIRILDAIPKSAVGKQLRGKLEKMLE